MLKTLLIYEFKALLKSAKVLWSILIFFFLFTVIFTVRVSEFKQRQISYIADQADIRAQNQNARNYSQLSIPVIKPPQLFSVYHQGYSDNFGRVFSAECFMPIFRPYYINSPLNSYFRFDKSIDITYLVSFFLSLFILLISFDSINREKEDGSLRLIFTFPVKRSQFILKKIFGIYLLGLSVYSIPFILSIIPVLLIFRSEITMGFWLQFLLSFLTTSIFILIITLMGVFCSLITKMQSRSLIYVLSLWLMITVIIPEAYVVLSNNLNNPVRQMNLTQRMKDLSSERHMHIEDLPSEIDPRQVGHWLWNYGSNYMNDSIIFGVKQTYEVHRKYNEFYYENIYPKLREEEQLNIELERLSINNIRLKPYYLFFNPTILYSFLIEYISANSFLDYIQHRLDAISIRDRFMQQGLRDGWLLGYEYFTYYSEDDILMNQFDFAKKINLQLDENSSEDEIDYFWKKYVAYAHNLTSELDKSYRFVLPEMPLYEFNLPSISDLFKRNFIFIILMFFQVFILYLVINKLFNKYDLR